MTSKFDSIEEFALYIQDVFLEPNLIFTEIRDNKGNHPTHNAMVTYGNEGMTDIEIQASYREMLKKINLLSVDYLDKTVSRTMPSYEYYDRLNTFFDSNHLYYNGDVFVYIVSEKPFPKKDRREKELQWELYVLNDSGIKDYSYGISEGRKMPLWLNTYTTTNFKYVRDAGGNIFYKIPIEKIKRMSFMNWERNPLQVIK